MRFFTEDELRNYYKKVIEEGEYATEITVGEYSTPQEANAVLDTIRKQYGFGRYDSRVDGTSVKVIIEKDPNDDSYFSDMINQMKNFGKQYKQVAENKKSKNMKKKITESQLRNIIKETVKNTLAESLNSIVVRYDSPTKGRNQMLAKSLQDAQNLIPSDATYFDISKGSNAADSENLLSWGGKNGYWDNATNPDFKWGESRRQGEIDRIMKKRKEI